jgi:hypothetical protein
VTARTAFAHLVATGSPRGADAVLAGARAAGTQPVTDRRRPWPVALAAAVLVVVLVGLVLVWRGGEENGETVRTGPGPSAPLAAPLFGEPTHTTLLINDGSGALTALDLDSGLAQRFDDLGALADRGRTTLLTLGGRVVYQGEAETRSLPVDLAGAPRSLGPSDFFFSAGRDDRLWLLDADRIPADHVRYELVTDDGSVVIPWIEPAGVDIENVGLDRYLATITCMERCVPGEVPYQLEDMATGATVPLPLQATAAWGATLVLSGGGDTTFYDLETDRTAALQPAIYVFGTTAISPDERTVVAESGGSSTANGTGDGGLVAIDTTTGRWRIVRPGGEEFLGSIDWTDDGGQAFELAPVGSGRARLTRYDEVTGEASVVSVALPEGDIVAVSRAAGPALDGVDAAACPEPSEEAQSPPTTGVSAASPADRSWITADRPCRVRAG